MSHPEPTLQPRRQIEPSNLAAANTTPGKLPEIQPISLPASMSLDDRLIQIESSLIGWALGLTGGNKTKAAEILKIKRSTLGDRINRCRLNGYDL